MTEDTIIFIIADLYEELGIYYLGFDVFEVCKKLHIDVIPYSKMKDNPCFYELLLKESNDGFSCIDTNTNRAKIYYNDSKTSERITVTLCHELGHICLGHLVQRSYISDEDREREATLFEVVFYTPLVILEYLNIITVEEIMKSLHISRPYAERTHDRLESRHETGTSKLIFAETRLLTVFKNNQKEHENK